MASSSSNRLSLLMEQGLLWTGKESHPSVAPQWSDTGYPVLNHVLGGGWPKGQLVEMLLPDFGVGECQAFLPSLRAATHQPDSWAVMINPPFIPYALAYHAAGVKLDQLLIIRHSHPKRVLWAMEHCLQSGCCSLVIGWLPAGYQKAIRRLQLATHEGSSVGLLVRPSHSEQQASPAPVRLKVSRSKAGVAVEVLKRRGGWEPVPHIFADESQGRYTPKGMAAEQLQTQTSTTSPALRLVKG